MPEILTRVLMILLQRFWPTCARPHRNEVLELETLRSIVVSVLTLVHTSLQLDISVSFLPR